MAEMEVSASLAASALLEPESAGEQQALDELQKHLERTVDTLWRCAVVVEDFNDAKQEAVLHSKVTHFLDDLRRLDKLADHVNAAVPVRVLRKIDKGSNPDLVTKEFVDMCRSKNDDTRGRIFATKVFKEQLQARLQSWQELVPLPEKHDRPAEDGNNAN